MENGRLTVWSRVVAFAWIFRQPLQVGAVLSAWFIGLPALLLGMLIVVGWADGADLDDGVCYLAISAAAFLPLVVLLYSMRRRYR